MSQLRVAADTLVTIAYRVFDDGNGEPCSGDEPIMVSFVQGYGQVLPAIEKALFGRTGGDMLRFSAEPEDAFGPHEPDGVLDIDLEGIPGADDLEVGHEVVAEAEDGEVIMRILEIDGLKAKVDTNHPLAGKTVRFELEVLAVREATEEEIASAEEDAHSDGACGCGVSHDQAEPDLEPLVQLSKKSN